MIAGPVCNMFPSTLRGRMRSAWRVVLGACLGVFWLATACNSGQDVMSGVIDSAFPSPARFIFAKMRLSEHRQCRNASPWGPDGLDHGPTIPSRTGGCSHTGKRMRGSLSQGGGASCRRIGGRLITNK